MPKIHCLGLRWRHKQKVWVPAELTWAAPNSGCPLRFECSHGWSPLALAFQLLAQESWLARGICQSQTPSKRVHFPDQRSPRSRQTSFLECDPHSLWYLVSWPLTASSLAWFWRVCHLDCYGLMSRKCADRMNSHSIASFPSESQGPGPRGSAGYFSRW